MHKTIALFSLATLVLGGVGCVRHHYVYGPGYYHHRGYYQAQPVMVQPAPVVYAQPALQQPPVVYQQPAYEQPPVVLQAPPQVYYYQPTGYYRRPALYNGVRVYVQ